MTAVLEFAKKSDRKSLYIFSELYSEDNLAVNNLYIAMAEVLHVIFVFCCQTQLRESAKDFFLASECSKRRIVYEIFWEI